MLSKPNLTLLISVLINLHWQSAIVEVNVRVNFLRQQFFAEELFAKLRCLVLRYVDGFFFTVFLCIIFLSFMMFKVDIISMWW